MLSLQKTIKPFFRSLCFLAISLAIHITLALVVSSFPGKSTHQKSTSTELMVTLQHNSFATAENQKTHPKVMPAKHPSAASPSSKGKSNLLAPADFKQFYEIKELDKPIKPLSRVDPQFPSIKGMPAGDMSLDLYVDITGRVESVTVYQSTLPKDYQEIAVNAFLNKYFEQGLINGQPVKVHLRIKLGLLSETIPGSSIP